MSVEEGSLCGCAEDSFATILGGIFHVVRRSRIDQIPSPIENHELILVARPRSLIPSLVIKHDRVVSFRSIIGKGDLGTRLSECLEDFRIVAPHARVDGAGNSVETARKFPLVTVNYVDSGLLLSTSVKGQI
jgi:hypothetical protein